MTIAIIFLVLIAVLTGIFASGGEMSRKWGICAFLFALVVPVAAFAFRWFLLILLEGA